MRDASGEAAPITIGIVAGEASGDALAATLIRAVRLRRDDIRFVGIAGPRMEADRLRSVVRRWSASPFAALSRSLPIFRR